MKPLFLAPSCQLTLVLLGLITSTMGFSPLVSAQVIRPFTSRFQVVTRGDIIFAGNTLMTCSGGCTAQNNNNLNNGSLIMDFVDVDGLGTNSSTSDLNLPNNAEVLFAGLYWGAYLDTSNPTQVANVDKVSVRVPGSNYTELSAVNCPSIGILPASERCQLDLGPDFLSLDLGQPYQGFVEITGFLPDSNGDGIYTGAEVNGTYGVGNIQARQGAGIDNMYAGWNMIIIYRDPNILSTTLPRSLQVYDGFAVITANNVNQVNIQLTGFLTPASGIPEVKLGSVVYEGDGGRPGEDFSVEGQPVGDPIGGTDDVFNGTIITDNSIVTGRNPNFQNQLGLDLDILDATGAVGNNRSQLDVTYSTTSQSEGYWPGVLTLSISSVGDPNLRLVKRITDIQRNGESLSDVEFDQFVDDPDDNDDNATGWSSLPQGSPVGVVNAPTEVQSGDVVEYTIYALSDGTDTADNVQICDPLPEGITFLEDSFGNGQGILLSPKVSGLPDEPQTNVQDSDRAFFVPPLTPVSSPCDNPNNPNGAVIINFGTLLNQSPSNVGYIRFRVRVN
ncbi:DUF11 domain-containing protein [Spirulina sp. CS-785/01]|uniref:DUF11 domain-containing protein n=1 Tax=Spirulina sp. CS-785/01 TaxID=3021716 RepID=UPI00232F98CA|nr:DUF11 domain-containing protein [Spirulina sp. CS-785/01]MDB9315836.1 DUF11 domain-containing protein [Spirulina sp. CS-785/01]